MSRVGRFHRCFPRQTGLSGSAVQPGMEAHPGRGSGTCERIHRRRGNFLGGGMAAGGQGQAFRPVGGEPHRVPGLLARALRGGGGQHRGVSLRLARRLFCTVVTSAVR